MRGRSDLHIWIILTAILLLMSTKFTDKSNTDKIIKAINNIDCNCQVEKE